MYLHRFSTGYVLNADFLSFTGLHAYMSYYYHGEKVNLTVDRNYVHH